MYTAEVMVSPMVVLSSVAEGPENQLPQAKMIMAAEARQTRIPKAQAMDCKIQGAKET